MFILKDIMKEATVSNDWSAATMIVAYDRWWPMANDRWLAAVIDDCWRLAIVGGWQSAAANNRRCSVTGGRWPWRLAADDHRWLMMLGDLWPKQSATPAIGGPGDRRSSLADCWWWPSSIGGRRLSAVPNYQLPVIGGGERSTRFWLYSDEKKDKNWVIITYPLK